MKTSKYAPFTNVAGVMIKAWINFLGTDTTFPPEELLKDYFVFLHSGHKLQSFQGRLTADFLPAAVGSLITTATLKKKR